MFVSNFRPSFGVLGAVFKPTSSTGTLAHGEASPPTDVVELGSANVAEKASDRHFKRELLGLAGMLVGAATVPVLGFLGVAILGASGAYSLKKAYDVTIAQEAEKLAPPGQLQQNANGTLSMF